MYISQHLWTINGFKKKLSGDILAKNFDCSFSEVAAADQVTEVSYCLYSSLYVLYKKIIGALKKIPTNN